MRLVAEVANTFKNGKNCSGLLGKTHINSKRLVFISVIGNILTNYGNLLTSWPLLGC